MENTFCMTKNYFLKERLGKETKRDYYFGKNYRKILVNILRKKEDNKKRLFFKLVTDLHLCTSNMSYFRLTTTLSHTRMNSS